MASLAAHPPFAAAPVLEVTVVGAVSAEFSAIPALVFTLRVEAEGDLPIRSVLLDVQVQIAARQRSYHGADHPLLNDLFGAPERWSTTLRTLPWTRATVIVPPFTGSTEIELSVPCTYDLEVAATRYFAALDDGEVPLEFLFSGSVFYGAPDGSLQVARIGWDREASYRLPVAVWRETMDRHFPGAAWLRVGGDALERLCAVAAARGLPSAAAALEALVAEASG